MSILDKLIPDVQTDFEHNSLNVYVSCEALQKQTEDLRQTVEALIEDEVNRNILGEWIPARRILIQKATGKSWEEVKELL